MFQNDVGTLLEFTCYDEDDTALDLTTAEHVYLFIKRGTEILKREMVIDDDPSSGKVSYTITEDDLTEGDLNYAFQIAIDFEDGSHFNCTAVEEHIAKPLEADYEEEE